MTIKPHQSAGTLTQELLNHLRHRLKVLVQDYELFLFYTTVVLWFLN